jgi:hypothetical protein
VKTGLKVSTILMLALVSAGCFKETPIVIASVALKVLPITGGVKFAAVDTTGLLISGTLAGGTNPVIHEDSTHLSRNEAAALIHDAAMLGDTLLRRAPVNVVEPTGGTVLAILFNDGSQSRIVWQTGHPHRDPRVNALAEKLSTRLPQ